MDGCALGVRRCPRVHRLCSDIDLIRLASDQARSSVVSPVDMPATSPEYTPRIMQLSSLHPSSFTDSDLKTPTFLALVPVPNHAMVILHLFGAQNERLAQYSTETQCDVRLPLVEQRQCDDAWLLVRLRGTLEMVSKGLRMINWEAEQINKRKSKLGISQPKKQLLTATDASDSDQEQSVPRQQQQQRAVKSNASASGSGSVVRGGGIAAFAEESEDDDEDDDNAKAAPDDVIELD